MIAIKETSTTNFNRISSVYELFVLKESFRQVNASINDKVLFLMGSVSEVIECQPHDPATSVSNPDRHECLCLCYPAAAQLSLV